MTRHDPDEQSREERMAELFGTLRQWSQSYRSPHPDRAPDPPRRRADPGDELATRRDRRQQRGRGSR